MHYKKQLEEKDKLIAKLKSRIQRLMANEIHQRGHIRNFQFERSRSQAELGKARNEMQQLSTSVKLLQEDLSRKVYPATGMCAAPRVVCQCSLLLGAVALDRVKSSQPWTTDCKKPRPPSAGGRLTLRAGRNLHALHQRLHCETGTARWQSLLPRLVVSAKRTVPRCRSGPCRS